jgi:hypothetical protein
MVILTERDDTATVERKIGGIKGKPRYYAIDARALHRLASERSFVMSEQCAKVALAPSLI